MTIAALSAVLRLYADPVRLAERLPVIRLLARPVTDIRAAAERLLPALAEAVERSGSVHVISCQSEIGSGALPTRTLESAGLAIRPAAERRVGTALQRIASAFRHLPVPVIGRIEDDAFIIDVRCLDDESAFTAQLAALSI